VHCAQESAASFPYSSALSLMVLRSEPKGDVRSRYALALSSAESIDERGIQFCQTLWNHNRKSWCCGN
jgi:hypothetical protein